MTIENEMIGEIVSAVFGEMLAMTPHLSDSAPDDFDQPIEARIAISGSVNEEIFVEAPRSSAAKIAEVMFCAQQDTLTDEEVRDALGEVANMIGGNVKGAIDGECILSLPDVTEPDQCSPRDDEHLGVTVDGHPIVVRWRELATESL